MSSQVLIFSWLLFDVLSSDVVHPFIHSNKRLKGLAKTLKAQFFPEYMPPPGLGRRVGPHGLSAGKAVDEAVQSLINTNKADNQPKWARLLVGGSVFSDLNLAS